DGSQGRASTSGGDHLDRMERGREGFGGAELAVMRDREAVRLIADALNQKHARRVALLDDRLRAPWREDLLAFLGQREGRNVRVAGRLRDLQRGAELALPTVDEDQVRATGERPIADALHLLAPLRGLEPLDPAAEHLLQHREVVRARR